MSEYKEAVRRILGKYITRPVDDEMADLRVDPEMVEFCMDELASIGKNLNSKPTPKDMEVQTYDLVVDKHQKALVVMMDTEQVGLLEFSTISNMLTEGIKVLPNGHTFSNVDIGMIVPTLEHASSAMANLKGNK